MDSAAPDPVAWTDDLRGRLRQLIDGYRAALRDSLDDLTEEEARRRLVPSKTTLLGLLKHVTFVEGVWFDQAVTGRTYREIGIATTPDRSFMLDDVVDGRGERSVWALYLQVSASSPNMPDTPTSCASSSWPRGSAELIGSDRSIDRSRSLGPIDRSFGRDVRVACVHRGKCTVDPDYGTTLFTSIAL